MHFTFSVYTIVNQIEFTAHQNNSLILLSLVFSDFCFQVVEALPVLLFCSFPVNLLNDFIATDFTLTDVHHNSIDRGCGFF